MRYFLKITYNGKNYNGWQIQNNAPSVQEKINDCISKQLKQEIQIVGSGRTDTGVHCKQQYAHFDINNELNKNDFLHKINAFLPDDIYIKDLIEVKEDAHARFSALSRSYEYHITLNKNPFATELAHRLMYVPDLELMNKAAEILLKYEDYEIFCKSRSFNHHYLCAIKEAYWLQENDFIIFHITANRFLRGMVRLITGTLLSVGFNKITIQDFENIIKNKIKMKATYSVPAKGLYLSDVKYKEEIYK